jgi:heptosyltransferase-2/heptosyltransferase-3
MSGALGRLRDAALPVLPRLGSRPVAGDPDTLLVVQPDALGDILLSQPAVRALRAAYPDKRLIAVVGPWSEVITRLAWPVDEVVTVEFPFFSGQPARTPVDPYRKLPAEVAILRRLRAADAVLLRPDGWWAAWLAWRSVSRDVITSDDPRMRPFATRTQAQPTGGHAAQRAYAIAAGLLHAPAEIAPLTHPLELPPDPAAAERVAALLARKRIVRPYDVLHPGAAANVKLWPAHRWRAVLHAQSSRHFVVTGAESERGLVADICAGLPQATPLVGETPLPELIELLRGAQVVLGTDTGPLHLAVAVRTPSVAVFGPSSVARYGPWGDPARHRAVSAGWRCPRCEDLSKARPSGCGCMLAVEPAAVLAAQAEVLGADGVA